MISFKILTEESKALLLDEIRKSTPNADLTFASDNMSLLLEDEGDVEYAVSYSNGCLLARIYDDEYCFMYPLALCDEADAVLAAMEIRAYAVKEEIPLVYIDVPGDALGDLLVNFRHINADITSPHTDKFYTVRVISELAMIDEIPSYTGYFGVSLTPFTPDDDEDYARLCMDEETNKYWGYDYSQDEAEPEISYFRRVAEAEFDRSTALCLAVRYKNTFVGEATLYYFDLMGGCECAIRILPEFRRMGYGGEALKLLKTIAKRMGIKYLRAAVYLRNEASVRMTEKHIPEMDRDDKQVTYQGKL